MTDPAASQKPVRVALITAASQGIGAGIARHLASIGYHVALLARSERVREVAAMLGGIAVTGSVTDAGALSDLVAAAVDHWGRIDAVVNNTGHPPKGDLAALTDADWQAGYELITASVIRMFRLVLPVMNDQGGGAIVNVSSYAARRPELERPVSSVFRAALLAVTRLQAEYGARHNVRVNSIMPGFVDTYPVDQATVDTIPLRRVASVDEIARTAAFLLSDSASYITGQNLLVDGGMVRTL